MPLPSNSNYSFTGIVVQDTAGEEKYASLSSFYCRGAHLALLAVDLTNKKTMDKLQEIFIPLLEQQAPNCMTVVVGTKLDLVKSEGRQIGTSEARSFAIMQHQKQLDRSLRENPGTFLNKVQGHESYFETSSKTGEGVTELFQYVERNMLIYLQKTVGAKPKTRPVSSEQTIRLDQAQQPPAAQSSGCCKGN